MEILLIGNTDFVTKQWIEHAFPHDKVVVALRKGTESSGEDLKIIDMPDRDAVSEVFSNYEFDRIVYFSEDLTPRSERDGDLGYLRRLLHTVRNRKVQMLMVSGPESEFTYPQETDVHETSKSLMSRAGEELGLYYARTYDLEVKIVRCPYNPVDTKNKGRNSARDTSSTFSVMILRNFTLLGITTPAMNAPNNAPASYAPTIWPNLSTAYSTTGPPTASCSTFRTCSTSLTAIWER
mgnify:CR=1 FL=1